MDIGAEFGLIKKQVTKIHLKSSTLTSTLLVKIHMKSTANSISVEALVSSIFGYSRFPMWLRIVLSTEPCSLWGGKL